MEIFSNDDDGNGGGEKVVHSTILRRFGWMDSPHIRNDANT